MTKPNRAPTTNTNYTRCRTIGHAWFDCDSDWKSQLGTPFTVRCERCGAERRDSVSRSTGEVLNRNYTYPPSYAYARNATPTKNDFRLALLSLRLKERRQARHPSSTTSKAKLKVVS